MHDNGSTPRLKPVTDVSQPIELAEDMDFPEEQTAPGKGVVVTLSGVMRALDRLGARFDRMGRWLVVSTLVSAGALLMVAALWVWTMTR